MPTIISPIPPVAATTLKLSRRPDDLRGARISILDNSKANAGPLLAKVVDELVATAGAVWGIKERKSSAGIPASEDILERLRTNSDLVLTASADCGSCTSGCVQDTVALEKLGVPAVLLGTDAFEPLAVKLADWLGLPDIDTAITPHPLGGITADELDAKAVALAELLRSRMSTTSAA